ncbi:MAG: ribonuclease P protein component [Gammaproteobacteria bacterium]|nr:ribonuclease P protein component [Gammaproteobacteria bacterium]MCW9058783.1 ribonuclease P protein component [Gammaproteobacteria bacterium]
MGNSQAFPRTARVTSAGEYRRVFQHSQCKSSDRWLTVLAVGNDLGHARLGLAISRKAEKTAVGRNRVKRIIRESFRHHQDELNAWDLVVIARPGVAAQTRSALQAALAKHWTRLQRTCVES